ncbi:hypothetical protein PORCELAIN_56 [Mycobacterium phage Porcelain]|uniref:Uncharacterized protein n=1 Tax=Mycobacterium phage Superphikiman TaxID=2041551 RepID=A0A2D2W3Z2_9CAUD|nr:hypothetical protein AVT17_gp057 [Mycobacterium phage Ariel]AIM49934.1 hypothetical protein PBI_ARIEL_57 [Mycobacterium phage Ariel]ASD50692.1 hypothetical protein PORCELAIN_56 [Mycobacterium phage Porcelain]ASZ74133.1 hypothetical protein SEA_SQUINT_57 [Mycobacterium phage Squint]ATS92901.1 hypothetical protein SEA_SUPERPHIKIMAN_58 [Mycobacterium phage Superphikiman]
MRFFFEGTEITKAEAAYLILWELGLPLFPGG